MLRKGGGLRTATVRGCVEHLSVSFFRLSRCFLGRTPLPGCLVPAQFFAAQILGRDIQVEQC